MAALLAAAALASTAAAQDEVGVRFEPGTSGTTINGTITGDEYVDYVLRAAAGQTLFASLEVIGTNGHGSAFFNILPAGQDFPALYNGSTDDDRSAEVTLPESREWAIRVYLMGNDRDTGKTVEYSIDVRIPVGESGGDAAAARWMRVTGVADDDVLNLRNGPGAGYEIVGALPNGERVRSLQCRPAGAGQWCEIEMQTEMRERGWVNARFLRPDSDSEP